jgi:tetratricopeptide (TPR) repeat protein
MRPANAAKAEAAKTLVDEQVLEAEILLMQCSEVRKNNAQKWEHIISALEKLFHHLNDRVLQTKILFEKAHFCYMAKGAFQQSIEICFAAKELFSNNDIDFEITFQSLLGTNFHLMGNYEKARPHYLAGIELLENKPEKSVEDWDSLAKLYYNTGLLHTNLINKENSVQYVEKALEIYTQINSKSGLARCYNALGHHHPQSQESENISIEYYLKAARYFEEDNDLIGLATAYNNIGYKFGMLKQIHKALHYLELSISLREKIGNKKGMAASYFYKGSVLEKNERIDEAIQNYHQAEKFLTEVNSKHELHSLYFHLSKTYAQKQNFEAAYRYHRLYVQLKEEIFNFDYNTTLSIEASKLLIEQQEREANFERQKQEELSTYIQKLEGVQNELTQMVFIASHDLREPIRMMTSYSLLISKCDNQEQNELAQLAKQIGNTTLLMWETLKNLQQSAQNKVLIKREKG